MGGYKRRQLRIAAEVWGELPAAVPTLLSHRALLAGELGPRYERKLCAVLEPETGRFLGTAVAVLRVRENQDE